MAATTTNREIVNTRVLPYSREAVFKAWTSPELLQEWWGPMGFTNTFEKCEIRPGGQWKFVMHGPDGANYPNESVFEEVVEPEKVVIRHSSAPHFTLTGTFEDKGGKTLLTFRQVFDSAADCDKLRGMCTPANEQNIDRLEMVLAKQAGKPQFVYSRVFSAPRKVLFAAATELDRMKEWWGPKGFTWGKATLELKPGGVFHYQMTAPNGQDMWGRFVYEEITAPDRIVFRNSFSDEKGGVVRAPFAANWPLEVHNTWLFIERPDGTTTLVLRGTPYNANAEEQSTFASSFGSLQQGFSGTLDQLAEYLAKQAACKA